MRRVKENEDPLNWNLCSSSPVPPPGSIALLKSRALSAYPLSNLLPEAEFRMNSGNSLTDIFNQSLVGSAKALEQRRTGISDGFPRSLSSCRHNKQMDQLAGITKWPLNVQFLFPNSASIASSLFWTSFRIPRRNYAQHATDWPMDLGLSGLPDKSDRPAEGDFLLRFRLFF